MPPSSTGGGGTDGGGALGTSSLCEIAHAHARRKEALHREAGASDRATSSLDRRRIGSREPEGTKPLDRTDADAKTTTATTTNDDATRCLTRRFPLSLSPEHQKTTTKTDAHERAALSEAAPRLASHLADSANEGAHAVHEAQGALAQEAACLSRELARLGAQLPAWAAAIGRLRESLKHAGDVAHSARRAGVEARALERVLREDAEGEAVRAAAEAKAEAQAEAERERRRRAEERGQQQPGDEQGR
jgi:colicin import membrane protein